MKNWILTTLTVAPILTAACWPAAAGAQQVGPVPRALVGEDTSRFSPAEFQRALAKLRSEREALDADLHALGSRLARRHAGGEEEGDKLNDLLKEALLRVQQDPFRGRSNPYTPSANAAVKPKQQPTAEGGQKNKEETHHEPNPESPVSAQVEPATKPVDPVHLAQTLFRAERYEAALAAFRKLDLKTLTAEDRGPVLLLTAFCLQQVGKTEEALSTLRVVANMSDNERFKAYAQWQIENYRWHNEAQAWLQEFRQRRIALEKR